MGNYMVAASCDCLTGEELIEVGLLDDLSPQCVGVLHEAYDPRDVAAFAITEAAKRDVPLARGFASVGYYASVSDTVTPEDMAAWAERIVSERGLCAACGDVLPEDYLFDEYDEDSHFCDNMCWTRWATPENRPDLHELADA